MYRWGKIVLFVGITVAVAGCPKGRTDFNQGRRAQDLHDYDAAFEYYQQQSFFCARKLAAYHLSGSATLAG